MKRKVITLILLASMICGMFTGCDSSTTVSSTGQGSNLSGNGTEQKDNTESSEENNSEGTQQEELQEIPIVDSETNIESKPEAPQEEQPTTPDTPTEEHIPTDEEIWAPDVLYDTTEDVNGDGIISFREDRSDGISGFTLHYNNDGSNTTYMVNYLTGQVIHPGDTYIADDGLETTWWGATPEDIAEAEKNIGR